MYNKNSTGPRCVDSSCTKIHLHVEKNYYGHGGHVPSLIPHPMDAPLA